MRQNQIGSAAILEYSVPFAALQPGSIVLFHNAAEHTPEALSGIIESLLADGYTIIPISEMILTGDYTIDNTGRQCPAQN